MTSDRFLVLSNSALKVVSGKTILRMGLFELRSVDLFLSRTLLCRYISSKVEPWFLRILKWRLVLLMGVSKLDD